MKSIHSKISVLDYGGSVLNKLIDIFNKAIRLSFPDIVDISASVMESGRPEFGDYQFNSAMNISQVCINIFVLIY
jgi:hypothetical protein